ncbi:hypothetical protein AVEN_81555-1 [Araneus ventricosus]|uniref:Uncharacterized protein n=1 Tax=Araneus ventricosus TaxID=182803 RepID=A0A4Y2QQ12_ARAVE|nr:hypothetical protein AVEN_81555-1 [Araneus ventricosus]
MKRQCHNMEKLKVPRLDYFFCLIQQKTKNSNGSERNAKNWIPGFLEALESKHVSGTESAEYYNTKLKLDRQVVSWKAYSSSGIYSPFTTCSPFAISLCLPKYVFLLIVDVTMEEDIQRFYPRV